LKKDKPIGWKITETIGVGVISSVLLMSEEEREKYFKEREEKARILREIGEPATEPPYVCPNGCDGPFRTHGRSTTLVGWGNGPDPNHWREQCSCKACGARFLKEWVPAYADGEPWFSVKEQDGSRVIYHGVCRCCCGEK
jgi:hypothetical protein